MLSTAGADNAGMMQITAAQIRQLPQDTRLVWQGGRLDVAAAMGLSESDGDCPCILLWYDTVREVAGEPQMCTNREATPDRMADLFTDFALDNGTGGVRPGRIEVDDPELAEVLRSRLEGAGIDVALRDSLPELDLLLAELIAQANQAMGRLGGGGGGQASPAVAGPLSRRGMDIARMRSFAEAAKLFHEAGPWTELDTDDLIQIHSPKPPKGMKYAVVLGAGGQEHGIGFYRRQDQFDAMQMAGSHEEAMANIDGTLWSLTFDDPHGVPEADAALWEEGDLPIAGADALPVLMGYHDVQGFERPTPKRLCFVEGLLRAIVQSDGGQLDSGKWTVEVETHDGPVTYELSLPDMLNPPAPMFGDRFPQGAMEAMQWRMMRRLEQAEPESLEEANELLGAFGLTSDEETPVNETPLEEAQALCYQALDASGRLQLKLAREALSICPDCADAYVMLARRALELDDAIALFEKGVEAGQRALGQDFFAQEEGHFWHLIETRPYMRALAGLAETLRLAGRKEEAGRHLAELLKLNPGDNQGVRDGYVALLLELDRDDEARALLKQYDEPSACIAYAKALAAYRKEGDSQAARAALKQARKVNRHVADELQMPEEEQPLPQFYMPGSREEAVLCASELHNVVVNTPGALDWLSSKGGRPQGGRGRKVVVKKRRGKSR